MKKVYFLLLMLIFLFLVVSCGKKEENSKEEITVKEEIKETVLETDKEEIDLPVDPDDYFKLVTFELPDDFRKAAVEYMRKQSSIAWTPEKTFKTGRQNENWGFELTYEEGKVYTGLLYSTRKASVDEFQLTLAKNGGKYTSEKYDYSFPLGVECNTSITHSLQQFTNAVTGKAETLMPSYADLFGGVVVGEYTVPDGVRQTAKIISANTPEVMYQAYSQLDVGDIIITKDEDKKVNHLRMIVEKPVVVTTASGKINPNRSYVVTIEQTDTFDKTRTDGVNTTWWVDHQYTLSKLLEKNYVPVSVEAYRTGVGVVPYIGLDTEITAGILEKGTLTGTITSNYPIRFIHINLYKKDGTLVSNVVYNGEFDTRKVNLRKYASDIFTDGMTEGEYTLEVLAGVSRGYAEIAKVNFIYG
ncbi:MAG: hypothetical protein IJN17_08835 [Clostridia bacterium]|nr:hypothetical protein [Clostridia bacterium]MBQ6703041.1 hypothetical protein [Clostridia bacterium]